MGCAVGYDPAVALFQLDRLSFEMQFGAALQHKADRLVIPAGFRLRFAGRLVFPKPHCDVNARRQILLTMWSSGRICRLYLLHRCIGHGSEPFLCLVFSKLFSFHQFPTTALRLLSAEQFGGKCNLGAGQGLGNGA